MIEQTNAVLPADLIKFESCLLVGATRLRVARRVVVDDDNAGRAQVFGKGGDDAWSDGSFPTVASRDNSFSDQPEAGGQKQDMDFLVRKKGHLRSQVVNQGLRGTDDRTGLQDLAQSQAASRPGRGYKIGDLAIADLSDALVVASHDSLKRAKLSQEVAGKI